MGLSNDGPITPYEGSWAQQEERRRLCHAYQVSDQMTCPACGLTWDMNDPEPPPCSPRTHARRHTTPKRRSYPRR